MKRHILLWTGILLLHLTCRTFAQDSYKQFYNQWNEQLTELPDAKLNILQGEALILLVEKTESYGKESLEYNEALLQLAHYCKETFLPDLAYVLGGNSMGAFDTYSDEKALKTMSMAERGTACEYIARVFAGLAEFAECFPTQGDQNITKYYTAALQYFNITKESPEEYTLTMKKLACYYLKQGEYKNAIEQFAKLKSVNKDTKVLSPQSLIEIENKLAQCYLMAGQTKEATKILTQLMETEQIPHTNLTYGLILNNAANLFIMKNDTTQALTLLKQAMKIYKPNTPTWKKIIGDYRMPESFTMLQHSAFLFQEKQMHQLASFVYKYTNSMLVSITDKGFVPYGGGYILWNSIRPYLDEILSFTYQAKDADLMFDTSQLYKSFFYGYFAAKSKVDHYKDPFYRSIYEQANLFLKLGFNTNNLSEGDKFWPITKCRIRRNNLAQCMSDYVSKEAQFAYEMKGEKADIVKEIAEGEAVIDFVSFPHPVKKGKTLCCATIFDKANPSPQIVTLCTKEELEQMLKLPPREQLTALSESFWPPLEKVLEKHSRLFLTISDEFSNIPFAGIKAGGLYLQDKYKLYTLSQVTNYLKIKNKEELSIKNIPNLFIFGGAEFGLPPTAEKDEVTRGQGFAYLLGSKKETELISDLWEAKGKNVTVYSGAKATKQNLDSLSYRQQSPSVLHISTHGFFIPFVGEEDNNIINAYSRLTQPMKRSGLALTGANWTWTNKDNIDLQTDNGIMSSLEISGINLSTTQLVVLSACYSGKEEYSGTEVTQGLQSAFSTSGAHSLLATLWEIPDKESVEMMEEFYRQWLSGLSKKDAFDKAMQKMRKSYPNEPEKWVGFILME